MGEYINRILLVDDDEPTIVLNKMVIEELGGIEFIHTASTGNQALSFLCDYQVDSPASQIDLILLDLNMPVMDGYEFLAKYQDLPDERKAKVIIVMLTTFINKEKEDLLRTLGTDGFKQKPLSEEILTDIQREFF